MKVPSKYAGEGKSTHLEVTDVLCVLNSSVNPGSRLPAVADVNRKEESSIFMVICLLFRVQLIPAVLWLLSFVLFEREKLDGTSRKSKAGGLDADNR